MKKILVVVGILSIVVLAFGAAGLAFAHNQTPPDSENPYGYGRGMMGDYDRGFGNGMFAGMGMSWNDEYGPMHETMVAAVADALGLSLEEIEARHDAGETLWEIAAAGGLSDEEIQNLMSSAHDVALEDAVANGWMTEEQTKWMDAHMEQMWNGDYGNGHFGGHCGGGW